MFTKVKNFFVQWGQGFLVAFFVILFVCPLSCKMTAEGVELIRGDYLSPKINSYRVIDNKHLELEFTEYVDISCIGITEQNVMAMTVEEENIQETSQKNYLGELSVISSKNESCDTGEKLIVEFNKETEIGKSYIVSGVVEDKSGNSLTFSAPFSGYNGKIPRMIITEVQNESAGGSKKLGLYRGEFVRLLALEDGNLFGLALGCAGKPNDNYIFPAIEVAKGESIIVHLQNKGNGSISELDDNLNLSFNDYSENGIRDLWRDIPDSIFGNSCDVIYLKDIINNKIIEGIAYTDGEKTEWADKFIPYVNKLADLNIFDATDINNACYVKKVTSLNTLHRKNIDEVKNKLKNNERVEDLFTTKDDWGVCKVKDSVIHR